MIKKGAQSFPVFHPALDTGKILLPTGTSKLAQIFLSFVQCAGGIDILPARSHFLHVLIANIFGGAADLLDDAAL